MICANITDFFMTQEDSMAKTYNIALIPGDGTGPEVVREGVKV